MLLECKDWDKKGQYIPNIKTSKTALYDYFILIRVSPSVEDILKNNRLFFSNFIDKDNLEKIILSSDEPFSFDIPGYMTHKTLLYLIHNNYIIPQNNYLNSLNTPMDADNYYIQAGSLRNIDLLFRSLDN